MKGDLGGRSVRVLALLSALFSFNVSAGTIVAAVGVVDSDMGEYNSGFPYTNMLDQSALSSNYVSGVTGFTEFTTSGVTHGSGDGNSWLSIAGVYAGYVVFDLGASYSLEKIAIWNGTAGITASPSSFTVTTSETADFGTSLFAGSFNPIGTTYATQVFDVTDSMARYVRLDIGGNFGNSCCTGIGDIAFGVNGVIPIPAAVWLFGSALAGLGWMRRKQTVYV